MSRFHRYWLEEQKNWIVGALRTKAGSEDISEHIMINLWLVEVQKNKTKNE